MGRPSKERLVDIRSAAEYEFGNPDVQRVYKELLAEIDAARRDTLLECVRELYKTLSYYGDIKNYSCPCRKGNQCECGGIARVSLFDISKRLKDAGIEL